MPTLQKSERKHVTKLQKLINYKINQSILFQEKVIYSWINPIYLEAITQHDVRNEFQDRSEIQLSDFLKSSKYKLLSEAFATAEIQWRYIGPPYKRHYQVRN